MHISPLTERLNTVLGLLSGKGDQMSLSSLEMKLFDSVEFCLALLGTIPVPIFIVNKTGKVITLSSGRVGADSHELICAHVGAEANGSGQWTIPSQPAEGCVFCNTVAKVRKSGVKATAKGEWQILTANGKTSSLIVTLHAAPAVIKDEDFILVAVEDQTEVEKLRGLLPICMECNKIHDMDSGKWVRVDQYVTDRSPAKFSHGLCPQCADRLLKEIEN